MILVNVLSNYLDSRVKVLQSFIQTVSKNLSLNFEQRIKDYIFADSG